MMRRAMFSKSMVTTGMRGAATVVAGTGGAAVALPAGNTAGTAAGATDGSSSLSGVNGVGSPVLSTAT